MPTNSRVDNSFADVYSVFRGIVSMIDGLDKQILNILQNDGRISNADIARQVNLAPSAVLERIRKLEAQKIIRGYTAEIDAKALDQGTTAIIAIRTSEDWEGVGELLMAIPEVQE